MRFSLMNLRASITVGGCKATSAASSHLRELALHSYSAVLRYNVTTHHRRLPGLFGSHAHSRGFVIHQGCVYEGDFCRNSNSSLQFPMSAHTLRYRQVDTSRVHVVTPSETPACPPVIYTNRPGTTSAPFHQGRRLRPTRVQMTPKLGRTLPCADFLESSVRSEPPVVSEPDADERRDSICVTPDAEAEDLQKRAVEVERQWQSVFGKSLTSTRRVGNREPYYKQ